MSNQSHFHAQFGRKIIGDFVSRVSLHVRKKMYQHFAAEFIDCKNVLDVGVTSENVAPEANYFEDLFPFKEKITALGVEDAQHLAEKYKGLKFIQIKEGQKFPFSENEFEVSFSSAVIEHIVDEKQRYEFVSELLRVSNNVFLTTPNIYFPLEVHTGMPLIHFLNPKMFYFLLERKIISKFYNKNNLKLLSYHELKNLAEKCNTNYSIKSVRLMGFVSNWILILRKKS